jgi:hypothetical protein
MASARIGDLKLGEDGGDLVANGLAVIAKFLAMVALARPAAMRSQHLALASGQLGNGWRCGGGQFPGGEGS